MKNMLKVFYLFFKRKINQTSLLIKGLFILAVVLIIVMSGCINSNEEDYANKISIALNDRPVVAYFYANWCAACTQQKPIIESLEEEQWKNVTFIWIDIDKDTTANRKYGVGMIPTTIVFSSELNYTRHIGLINKETLNKSIQDAIINHNNSGA